MPIGHKITPHGLRDLFSRVKSHINAGYNHTKNFVGKVDHAVNVGNHIYNAIEPVKLTITFLATGLERFTTML